MTNIGDGEALSAGGGGKKTSLSNVSRRHLMMGVGLLAVSGIAYARKPTRRIARVSDKQFEALFPRSFGEWTILPASELVMPPESELANKLYEHILTRSYSNATGQVVMFLAAYSSVQIDDVQVHRPEVCYAVSGFSIDNNQPYTLKIDDRFTVPARFVDANAPMRQERILYWTRVDDRFPANWSQQRLAMLVSNLEGFYPDGILVRASVINAGEPSATILTDFYRALTKAASPETLRILYGVSA